MSFKLFVLGFAIVIAGLVYGAIIMHVPGRWIAVSTIILVGIAIVAGVTATRHKDPAA